MQGSADHGNNSVYEKTSQDGKLEHKFTKLWPFQSLVGILGTILNSLVFKLFFNEKGSLATSVNVMIWFDTAYCFFYSAIFLHWRSFLLFARKSLIPILDFEVVNSENSE